MRARLFFASILLLSAASANAVDEAPCDDECAQTCADQCKEYGFKVYDSHPCECVEMEDGGTCTPDPKDFCTDGTGGITVGPAASSPRFRFDFVQLGGFEEVIENYDWPLGAGEQVEGESAGQVGVGVVFPVSDRLSLDIGLQHGSETLRRGVRFGESRVDNEIEMDVDIWGASLLGRVDLTDGARIRPWLSGGLRSLYLAPESARLEGNVSRGLEKPSGSESRSLPVVGGGIDAVVSRVAGVSAFANYGPGLGWSAGLSLTAGREGHAGLCEKLRNDRNLKRRSASVLSVRASTLRHVALTARTLGGPAALRERAQHLEEEAATQPAPQNEALLEEANELKRVARRMGIEEISDDDPDTQENELLARVEQLSKESDGLENRVVGLLAEVGSMEEELDQRRCGRR
jgi:hypothetical protein